jgi:hypothetical protein
MYLYRNIEAHSRKHFCHGKVISVSHSQCVSAAFDIQHARCICHIILSSEARLVLLQFSILSHKWHNFRKKKLWKIKYVFISPRHLSEIFLILRRTQPDTLIKVYWYTCKVPVSLVRFQWNLNFLYRFSKNTQISNFTKIRPLGAKL